MKKKIDIFWDRKKSMYYYNNPNEKGIKEYSSSASLLRKEIKLLQDSKGKKSFVPKLTKDAEKEWSGGENFYS